MGRGEINIYVEEMSPSVLGRMFGQLDDDGFTLVHPNLKVTYVLNESGDREEIEQASIFESAAPNSFRDQLTTKLWADADSDVGTIIEPPSHRVRFDLDGVILEHACRLLLSIFMRSVNDRNTRAVIADRDLEDYLFEWQRVIQSGRLDGVAWEPDFLFAATAQTSGRHFHVRMRPDSWFRDAKWLGCFDRRP